MLDPRSRISPDLPQQPSPEHPAAHPPHPGYAAHAVFSHAGYPHAAFPRFVYDENGFLRAVPPETPEERPRRRWPPAPRRLVPAIAVLLAGVLAADLVVLGELTGREEPPAAARREVAVRQERDPGRYVAATRPGSQGAGAAAAGNADAYVAPVKRLREPHLFVAANRPLSRAAVKRVRRTAGVAAAEVADAAEVIIDGKRVRTMGVNPSTFRAYTPEITAGADGLWRNVAGGDVAVSFVLGRDGGVALGSTVDAGGRRLRVGAWATVGIGAIDAIVSRRTARSLGIPQGNVLIVSAPKADTARLRRRLLKALPKGTQVATINPVLVEPRRPAGNGTGSGGTGAGGGGGQAGNGSASGSGNTGGNAPGNDSANRSGNGGGNGSGNGSGGGPGGGAGAVERRTDWPADSLMSADQIRTVLTAAASKIGSPYVWGAAGSETFDCSGLVQWAFAQAGVRMPRVTNQQWVTGPRVPLDQARPGDLLFWRSDPTNPGFISHVAIFWGDGKMLHAPRTGDVVKISPIHTANFAGVVRVSPEIAARVR